MAVSKKKSPKTRKKKAKERKKKQTYIHTHKSTHAIVVWHIAAKKGRFSRLTSGFLCVNLEWWWWWEEEEGRWRFHLLAYSLFCVCTHPTHNEQTRLRTHKIGQLAISLLYKVCVISLADVHVSFPKLGKFVCFWVVFRRPTAIDNNNNKKKKKLKRKNTGENADVLRRITELTGVSQLPFHVKRECAAN